MEYIKSISGVQNELDDKTQSMIGKLLVDEEDEDLTPDSKTYSLIYGMLGGSFFFGFYIIVQIIRRIQWHS